MPKINIIVDNDLYLRLIKTKSEIQKQNPSKIINFTDAVKYVLRKGLDIENFEDQSVV